MILLIDNYDSFSFNLYQYIGELAQEPVRVIRNDELTTEEIKVLHPSRIILSPGPGRPEDAGVIMDLVGNIGPGIPVLGVCLGHQAKIMTDCPLFAGLPASIPVARYHSLAADASTLPSCLQVIAETEVKNIKRLSRFPNWNTFRTDRLSSFPAG